MFGFGKREKYCPICGMTVADSTFSRFGQQFCSDEHQDMFVKAEMERQKQSTAEQNQQRQRRPPLQIAFCTRIQLGL